MTLVSPGNWDGSFVVQFNHYAIVNVLVPAKKTGAFSRPFRLSLLRHSAAWMSNTRPSSFPL